LSISFFSDVEDDLDKSENHISSLELVKQKCIGKFLVMTTEL